MNERNTLSDVISQRRMSATPAPRLHTPEIRTVSDVVARTGESPVWDATTATLYWVDIDGRRLLATASDGTTVEHRFELPVCSLGVSAVPEELVVALADGVYRFDRRTARTTLIARPEPDPPTNRLNDGKVGPDGAFWVGSMDDCPIKAPVAALYRVFPDGKVERIGRPVTVSNGLAFSPDGTAAYHSDSRGGRVYRYALAPRHGGVGPGTVFVEMRDGWGRPDGAAVDSEGCYWSCGIDAGRINRFSATGELVDVYRLPVAHPTMCCFGGADHRTLFVTSLRKSDGNDAPLAGRVLAFDVAVPGAPVGRFGAPAA